MTETPSFLDREDSVFSNQDLSPIEHILFLASSTHYKGEIINSTTIFNFLDDPEFINGFLLKPLINDVDLEDGTNSALSERRKNNHFSVLLSLITEESQAEFFEKRWRLMVELSSIVSDEDIIDPIWELHILDDDDNKIEDSDVLSSVKLGEPYSSYANLTADKEAGSLQLSFSYPR